MSEMRDRLDRHLPMVGQETSDPNYVAVRKEHLQEIWNLAHEAVHPPEEPDEPNIERGYDETDLRMQCLHLGTQVDIARMHASRDGQWHSDPVGLAEAYLHFLKGDGDVKP